MNKEKPIVELVNCGGKTYVQLRPYFGGYRRNPYPCDTADGREHWWNHLMESKVWFLKNHELQDKFNETWNIYEQSKEYYNGRNWKRGRQADSYQIKLSVKDCWDLNKKGKLTRKVSKIVDAIIENYRKEMNKYYEQKNR